MHLSLAQNVCCVWHNTSAATIIKVMLRSVQKQQTFRCTAMQDSAITGPGTLFDQTLFIIP